MALLTPSQAEPPPSSSSWRRWLNPRDPRGTTLWGTVAMSLAWWALYALHGSPSEVWPNRCALLRAQLEVEPRYTLTASEVLPPPLFEGLTLERAHLQRDVSGLRRVIFEGRELNAEGSITQVSAQLTTHPSGLIERLMSALDLPSERSAWLPSAQPLLDQSPLNQSPMALTRLGLSTTPQALSCAPDQFSQELPLALGLLLKGGVISPFASLKATRIGRWGASGWWMTEGEEARFWNPLSVSSVTLSAQAPQSTMTAQEPHSLLVWLRRPLEKAIASRVGGEPLVLADNPQDTASLAQRLLSATSPSAVEALLGGAREERP